MLNLGILDDLWDSVRCPTLGGRGAAAAGASAGAGSGTAATKMERPGAAAVKRRY